MANRAECEAVVRRLWPFLDGALADDEQEQVVRHLEACTNCASHFDFARAFLDAVARAGARPPNEQLDGLQSRVLAALSAEGFDPSR